MKIINPESNHIFLTKDFQDIGQLKTTKRGESIFRKGDSQKGFSYILSGLVGLMDIAPNGTESLLRVYGHNSFIGYRTFISEDNFHATSIALTDVNYLFFDFESPNLLLQQYPDIYAHLSKVLCSDLRMAEERLNDITGKRVINRIIETLIYLKQKDPHYVWTRREIGEFCSATTETVTRTLSKLEKLELIQKDGRNIIVNDYDRLLDYSLHLEAEL